MNVRLLVVLAVLWSMPVPAQEQGWLDGRMIGSAGQGKIELLCQGLGPGKREAIKHACQGCTDWYVRHYLIHTDKERTAYRARRSDLLAAPERYLRLPDPKRQRGIRISEKEIRVRFAAVLDKDSLRKELVKLGVVMKRRSVGDQGPTALVRASGDINQSQHARTIRREIESSLIKLGYQIVPLSTRKTKRANQAALVVVFEAERQTRKFGDSKAVAYEVSVNAIDSSTNRLVAAERTTSAPRSTEVAGEETAAVLEATNDALVRMEGRLEAFLKSH